jgi:flagellar motor switch protein FliG
MSMLARYRKPGGINQLIALLETCLSKKRETLMNTINAEDADFGALVRAKILTAERIFKWDPLTICEATTRMSDRTLAICLKGLPVGSFEIATHTMRDLKKREVKNIFDSVNPTPVEIESAQIKLVEIVRNLEKEGSLRLDDKSDPLAGAMKKAA